MGGNLRTAMPSMWRIASWDGAKARALAATAVAYLFLMRVGRVSVRRRLIEKDVRVSERVY